MATTTFLEPGLDATQDTSFFSGSSSTTYDSSVAKDGTGSMKTTCTAGNAVGAFTKDGVVLDAGGCISFYARFDTPSPASITCFLLLEQSNNGSGVMGLGLNTNGTLRYCNHASTVASGSTVLSANTFYRITMSYTNVSTSTWACKIYINGVLEINANHTGQGNGDRTGIQCIAFGPNISSTDSFSTTSAMSIWFDDIYVDNRTDLTDCGDIRVTAKRPFSNGTTNGFTTQIGSGGSGYGSGHAPQVNERPLSTTNGWSIIGAGSATTEEYTIEGASVGDVNISGNTLVDFMGWVSAKAALSETASIMLAGTTSNISLTSTTTIFTKAAGSTTYPAGGTDIGIVTSTTVTTVSLYECGIMFAYLAGTLHTMSLSGTYSTSGTLNRRTNKSLAASYSASGNITRLVNKLLSASYSTSGILNRSTSRTLPGATYQASGNLSKRINRPLNGTYSTSGSLTKLTNKLLAATYSTSGSIISRIVSRILTATYSTSGNIVNRSLSRNMTATYKTNGSLNRLLTRSLIATMSTSGSLTTQTNKPLNGSYSSSGTIVRSVDKSLSGSYRTSGSLLKTAMKSFTGLFSSSGSLQKQTNKVLSASDVMSGSLQKQSNKNFTATESTSGSLNRQVAKGFGGTYSTSGVITKLVSRIFSSSFSASGNLNKQTNKNLGSTYQASGLLKRQSNKFLTGTDVKSGSLTRQISKSFGGTMSFAGNLFTKIRMVITKSIFMNSSPTDIKLSNHPTDIEINNENNEIHL